MSRTSPTDCHIPDWQGCVRSIRHVKGIEFHDVTVGIEKEGLSPVLIADDVDGLDLDNFKAERPEVGEPSVVLKNVRNMTKFDFDG